MVTEQFEGINVTLVRQDAAELIKDIVINNDEVGLGLVAVSQNLVGDSHDFAKRTAATSVLRSVKNCTTPVVPGGSIDSYPVPAKLAGSRVPYCQQDLEQRLYSLPGIGGESDIIGTQLADLLIAETWAIANKDMSKNWAFGNMTTSDDRYDLCDGVFTLTAAGGRLNSRLFGTALATGAWAAGAVYTALTNVTQNAPAKLRGIGINQKALYVDEVTFYAYAAHLEATTGIPAAYQFLVTGADGFGNDRLTPMLRFQGIPVYPMPNWNEAFTDLSLSSVPKRIVYAANGALRAELDRPWTSQSSIKIWYSNDDDVLYIQPKVKFAFGVPDIDLIYIASTAA